MTEENRREGEARDEREDGTPAPEEHGDVTGATSTHAGAGGQMGNTGGTGTAPVGGEPD